MSMSATAVIAFGVDLGDGGYGESNFEDEGESENDFDWEGLLSEFAGWTEAPLPYGQRGTPEYDAWSAQLDRKSTFRSGVNYGSYGDEFSGTYLAVGSAQRAEWECKPIGPMVTPGPADIFRLLRFIGFLDTKGLKLKPEHRTPHWMLMASYG